MSSFLPLDPTHYFRVRIAQSKYSSMDWKLKSHVLLFFLFALSLLLGKESANASSLVRSEKKLNGALKKHEEFVLQLYSKYRVDLQKLHEVMIEWDQVPKDTLVGVCHGHMSVEESELLYMRVREKRPDSVFELGPACGWSSLMILTALSHNGHGKLSSFDIEKKAPVILQRMNSHSSLLRYWNFIEGPIQETYNLHKLVQWGFVYIDALHENHFATWYIENVLKPITLRDCNDVVPVQIHDIWNPFMIPGGYYSCLRNSFDLGQIEEERKCMSDLTKEIIQKDLGKMDHSCYSNQMFGPEALSGEGASLVQFLAFIDTPKHVFTISPFKNLGLFERIEAARKKLHLIRAPKVNIYNPSIFFDLTCAR